MLWDQELGFSWVTTQWNPLAGYRLRVRASPQKVVSPSSVWSQLSASFARIAFSFVFISFWIPSVLWAPRCFQVVAQVFYRIRKIWKHNTKVLKTLIISSVLIHVQGSKLLWFFFSFFFSLEGWCGINMIRSSKTLEAVMGREGISVTEHLTPSTAPFFINNVLNCLSLESWDILIFFVLQYVAWSIILINICWIRQIRK